VQIFATFARAMIAKKSAPSRRNISISPSPVKLIDILCTLRILMVLTRVRVKIRVSNIADASHAKA